MVVRGVAKTTRRGDVVKGKKVYISDKKHIVVRTDSDIANEGDYDVTFHFDLQKYGSIESESFTVTQMVHVPPSV